MQRSKKIDVATAGSHELVAGVAGNRIRVTGIQLLAAADVTVTIEDSDGTDLSGPMPVAAKRGFSFAVVLDDPVHANHYQIADVGKGLHLRLSDSVAVGGMIQYTIR